MSALQEPKNAAKSIVAGLDEDSDASFIRIAIAVYTITMLSLAGVMAYHAKKAAKQAGALLKTLVVLVVVYALYRAMARLLTGIIAGTAHAAISQLTSRGDLSERVANAIGIAIAAAVVVALARVMVWSIRPLLDKMELPDPEQTSVSDYLKGEDDVPDGSMAEDILDD